MTVSEELSNLYAAKFWELYKGNEAAINRGLDKLLWAKGIPPERHDDFKHTTFQVCCSRMIDYDPALSSFTTWTTWQARAVLRNFFKGFRPRNPVGEKFFEVEADLFDPTMPDRESPYEQFIDTHKLHLHFYEEVPDDSAAYREHIEDSLDMRSEIAAYRRALEDFPVHRYVFNRLMESEFDISDRELEAMTGISRTTIGRVRHEIYFELGMRLIRMGLTITGG